MKRIRIIGVGNILMGDDGVGIEAANLLSQRPLPAGIEVIDGGTGGLALLSYLETVDFVIFIDAVDAGVEPGTIMRVQPEEILADSPESTPFSLHAPAVPDLLRLAAELGITPPSILFGVQVASVSPGIGLSPPLVANLERLLSMVLDEAAAILSPDALI